MRGARRREGFIAVVVEELEVECFSDIYNKAGSSATFLMFGGT